MPRYEFQCDCGLRFEAVKPASQHSQPTKCIACGEMASRAMPDAVSGVFNQTVTGPGPQNTGVHSLDVHIDRVIGQHAKQGWEAEDARQQEKRRVLRQNPGAKTEDLSLQPDGSYRVRKPEEKQLHYRAWAINHLAQQALKKPPTQ